MGLATLAVVLVVVACSVIGVVILVEVLSVVDMIGSLDRCHHVTIRVRKGHAHQHRMIEVSFIKAKALII